MLIVPELNKVIILVPRTGTNYLKEAVRKRWPNSFLLYRHMERDGVPYGYERYETVGVFREPVDRLYSLFKYLRDYDHDQCHDWKRLYMRRLTDTTSNGFNQWLVSNELPIATPYGTDGTYHVQSSVKHIIPENKKSQWCYLRPDYGTTVIPYSEIHKLLVMLDIPDERTHVTEPSTPPPLTAEGYEIINTYHHWDTTQKG